MANETVEIFQMTDDLGNPVAPKTPISAVYDSNGDKLDDILDGLNIQGKINTLNSVTQQMKEEIEAEAETAIQGAVKVTAQTFTDTQKAQARKNIGAVRAGQEIADPVGDWQPKSAQQYINQELAKVKENISGLQGQIDTEKNVREAEDKVLEGKIGIGYDDIQDEIDAIRGTGTGSLGDLQGQLNQETENRLAAENNLMGEINECARIGEGDNEAELPTEFDPYEDTLHKSTQSLTTDQKKAINSNILMSGTTANRPTGVPVGFQFFDTTINKPVYKTSTGWVDAMGSDV